jgi:hypothetical protein
MIKGRTYTEETMVCIWCAVLILTAIGVLDGDVLLATTMISGAILVANDADKKSTEE